jgi:hypothetical protein
MLGNGHKSLVAVMVMLTLGLTSGRASADSKQEAAEHFASGVRLIDIGKVQEGLQEFLRAYELSPNYVVLYNIAQARVDLHQYCQAEQALRDYLREGGPHISKARRTTVDKQINDLEEKIGKLDIQVNVPGAAILVDGVEIGRSPLKDSVKVDAGEHVVSATASGYLPVEQQVSLNGKQQVALHWSLSSEEPSASTTPRASRSTDTFTQLPPALPASGTGIAPTPVNQPKPVQRDRTASSSGGVQRGIGVATGGLGLVGIGIGTGFAIRSISKGNESDRHCRALACDAAGVELNRQSMDATKVSIVGFAVGGAALVSGITLYLTAPRATAESGMHHGFWVTVAVNGAALGSNW